MKIDFQKGYIFADNSNIILMPVFAETKVSQHDAFKSNSDADKKYIAKVLKDTWKGTFQSTLSFFLPESGRTFVLYGLGEKAKWTQRKMIVMTRFIMKDAQKSLYKDISLILDDLTHYDAEKFSYKVEIVTQNIVMALYAFRKYQTPPKDGFFDMQSCTLVSQNEDVKSSEQAISIGQIIGTNINKARDLGNESASVLHPDSFAKEVTKLSKDSGIKVKVLDDKAIRKLGMNGLWNVGRGSDKKPRLIVMEYMKGKATQKPYVFVGKGITFDSGGLNIKPRGSQMEKMNMDMSGGAAVVSSLLNIATLNLKINVVGLIPTAENMISGDSYRPGDVIKMMSGKFVGVVDTDAEGRLILADALTYAEKYKPEAVIDVATLTGGAMVALGLRASAVFSQNQKLADELLELGERTGDYAWQLPLWEEYVSEIKGPTTDILNLGNTVFGQSIHGAIFLAQFAEKYAWAHVDIAPRMEAIADDFLAPYATGDGIRLLTAFARNRAGKLK